VTHREQLDILAEIYASCLSGLHKLFPSGYWVIQSFLIVCIYFIEHLIPNLTLEVYFILQMLTSRNVQPDSPAVSFNGDLGRSSFKFISDPI
jgi:hypothetical protein